jgi:hypothetical protein
MPNEMLMMNCTATMLHRVRRQPIGSSVVAGAGSFIAATIRRLGYQVKPPHARARSDGNGFASRAVPRY